MNIRKTKNTFFPKDYWFVFKLHFKIIYMTMKHIFLLLWCKSEPILPIHSFWIWPAVMKTWMIIYFKPVRWLDIED